MVTRLVLVQKSVGSRPTILTMSNIIVYKKPPYIRKNISLEKRWSEKDGMWIQNFHFTNTTYLEVMSIRPLYDHSRVIEIIKVLYY